MGCFGEENDAMFSCGGSLNIQIPYDFVNDDYCDCMETGNDEWQTSACNNGQFLCEIDGKYIHSALVNDGICDCSDAADEWLKDGQCQKYNTKIKHIQNDFALFGKVMKSFHYLYENVFFPEYVVLRDFGSEFVNPQNKDHHNYQNIGDVHRFLREKKDEKNAKDRREAMLKRKFQHKDNLKDNAFPYDDRYKPPPFSHEVDNGKGKTTNVSEPADSKMAILFMIILTTTACVGYLVKIKYSDKSKQN